MTTAADPGVSGGTKWRGYGSSAPMGVQGQSPLHGLSPRWGLDGLLGDMKVKM